MRALADMAPDLAAEIHQVLERSRNGQASVGSPVGTVPDGGGPFENEVVVVAIVAEGKLQRWEAFDMDDADRAVARLRELGG